MGLFAQSWRGGWEEAGLMHLILPAPAEFKTFPTLSKERLLQMLPPRPPQQNRMGRRVGCFLFLFFSFLFLLFFFKCFLWAGNYK